MVFNHMKWFQWLEASLDMQALDLYHQVLSILYPASYILVRSIVGIPSVLWLCWQLHETLVIPDLYKYAPFIVTTQTMTVCYASIMTCAWLHNTADDVVLIVLHAHWLPCCEAHLHWWTFAATGTPGLRFAWSVLLAARFGVTVFSRPGSGDSMSHRNWQRSCSDPFGCALMKC